MKLTSNQSYYLAAAVVIVATAAGIVVAYPQLPQTVPIHWDIHGQVNGWASKSSLFLYGPVLMAAIVGLFAALPWLSPRKFEVDSFRTTYLYIMIVSVGLMAYIQILILVSALGAPLDVSRAIEGCVCLMTALIGNVLGKVRRNFYVGIRTPWTIASERVWNRTHRLAAKTSLVAGLLGLIEVVLRAPFWLPIATILSGPFIPAIYSLVYYKQLEHRGELN